MKTQRLVKQPIILWFNLNWKGSDKYGWNRIKKAEWNENQVNFTVSKAYIPIVQRIAIRKKTENWNGGSYYVNMGWHRMKTAWFQQKIKNEKKNKKET